MEVYSKSAAMLAIYTIFVYPFLLWIIGSVYSYREKRSYLTNNAEPTVTVIVAVHNAESAIEAKIENLTNNNYDPAKIDYLFVDDGCTDGTVAIIQSNPLVNLISLPIRQGKERALAQGIAEAKGEILIFTDVDTLSDSCAVSKLVRHFEDPYIGAVSSYDIVDYPQYSLKYWYIIYEMYLRSLESKLGCSVGVSGSLFATRKILCEEFNAGSCSDLEITIICAREKLGVITDRAVKAVYKKSNTASGELSRTRRTMAHGIFTVINNYNILNPYYGGLYSWQIFSHKILRWLLPYLILAAIVSGAITTVAAMSYYVVPVTIVSAILAYTFVGLNVRRAINENICCFLMAIFSVSLAIVTVVRNKEIGAWSPTKR
ncbi:glycosyltransferase [Marinobacter salicampi]|uniref:glycosyltransferase n=1 Tax=Marinobacter salicampi TaxID=435907 RepID=UPI00140D2937|nr:glycosyltransferase [Marinobacter salicampi]